jgi:peptidoglycan-associated lipoprotein
MRQGIVVMLVAMSLGLAACASNKPKTTPPPPAGEAAVGANAAGTTANSAGGTGADEEVPGPQAGVLAKRVVYFDFDSSEIKGEGTDIVAAHAKYLANTASARVRLEGHTDERGSREYNIGLGERRAQAVRRALLLQGASDGQISTVSYGEERPAVAGHDETAWAKNRRVEIVYLTPGSQPPQAPNP